MVIVFLRRAMVAALRLCKADRSAIAIIMLSAIVLSFAGNISAAVRKPDKPLAPALIAFGDSTMDPGNNNNLYTIVKSNFAPYGKDFVGHKPTGRFCNGKLSIDFIAEGLGIKETLPAYLDPELSSHDLLTGVSFASAGTGYDNRTSQSVSVISLWQELEYFKEYRMRLEKLVGTEHGTRILHESIFLVSIGSNDFLENYYVNPFRRLQYSVSEYQDFLLQVGASFLQELYNLGARKIAVAGLPPLGCLPLERTMRVFAARNGSCVEALNQDASGFNIKLGKSLDSLKSKLPGIKMVYADIYYQLINVITDPAKHGFENTRRGCCGTGLIEAGYLCNRRTSFICSDASKYVFWDSSHPTEKMYEMVANDLLNKCIPKLL